MPQLVSMTVNLVCDEVPLCGFTKQFWKSYRSTKCKSSNVGKCLAELGKLGMTQSGSLNEVSDKNLHAVFYFYKNGLRRSLINARTKAENGGARQSVQFCNTYISIIDDEIRDNQKRLKTIEERLERDSKITKAARQSAQKLLDLIIQLRGLKGKFSKANELIQKAAKDITKVAKSSVMSDMEKYNVIGNIWETNDPKYKNRMKGLLEQFSSINSTHNSLLLLDHELVSDVKLRFDKVLKNVTVEKNNASTEYTDALEFYTNERAKVNN